MTSPGSSMTADRDDAARPGRHGARRGSGPNGWPRPGLPARVRSRLQGARRARSRPPGPTARLLTCSEIRVAWGRAFIHEPLAWTARAFLHEHGGISKRDGRCWMRTVERTGVLSLACGSAQVGDASLELRPGRVPVLRIGGALACIAALALAILITALPGGKPASPGRGLETAAATGLPASLVPAASASIGASQQRFWPVRRGASLATQGGGIESSFSASGARLGVAGGALSMSLA